VLSVLNVQTNHGGDYSVVVSNAYGTVTSAVAILTVVGPPLITLQPISQTAFLTATVEFSVEAANNPSSYQWFHNGQPLPGATNATLVLANVQEDAVGFYHVFARNLGGTTTSQVAELQMYLVAGQLVHTGLVIVSDYRDLPPCPPREREFGLLASSGFIPGVLNHGVPVLAISSSGQPDATIPSICGIPKNNPKWAKMNVFQDKLLMRITTEGSTNVDTVMAVHPPLGTNSNQPSSEAIACNNDCGTNKFSELQFKAEETVPCYYLALQFVELGTKPFQLLRTNAVDPPKITTPPVGHTVYTDSPVSFSVSTEGSECKAYRWLFNGMELTDDGQFSGSISPTLTLCKVRFGDAGQYSVVVTNVGDRSQARLRN
jgi:hypothetical protein